MRVRKPKPPKEWVHEGALVWFQSFPGPEGVYPAVVDCEPWLLGGHTWVVHLRAVGPNPVTGAPYHHGRTRCAGAGVEFLTSRSTEKPPCSS